MEAARQRGGLEVALDVWRRRKWPAILVFAAVFTAVVSVVVFLPDVYQSTATIIVDRQQIPEAFVPSTVTSGIDVRLQTITQQSLSRSRLEGLMSRFGLYTDLRQQMPLEDVLERMRKDIRLEQKDQRKNQGQEATTIAFTISYKGRNPQLVAQVTNTLASFYIDENLKAREQQAAGTSEFLRVQLEAMKQKLEAQEKLLGQFKERSMGELPEQLQANIAVLERLNTQLRLNSEKQARMSAQRAALAQQLAELEGFRPPGKTTGTVAPDTKPETPEARLDKLRQELVVLRTRFSDQYPDVVWLQSQIAVLEQELAKTASTKTASTKTASTKQSDQVIEPQLNPYVQQLKKEFGTLEAEMKGLHTEEQDLLRSIVLYQQRVESVPRREQELQVLLRDYDTAKGSYQSLLKRHEEAHLAETLEQRQKGEQFRLLEPAIPAEKPVEPDRRKFTLMGLVLALGLAVGTVILAESLDVSFHTVDDLRAFSPVPVLVSLPQLVTRAATRRRQWRFGLTAISTILGLGLIVGTSYVAIKGQAQLARLYEQLQHLRQ